MAVLVRILLTGRSAALDVLGFPIGYTSLFPAVSYSFQVAPFYVTRMIDLSHDALASWQQEIYGDLISLGSLRGSDHVTAASMAA